MFYVTEVLAYKDVLSEEINHADTCSYIAHKIYYHTFNNIPFSVPTKINSSSSTCNVTDDINTLRIECMFSSISAGKSSPLIASRSTFNESDFKLHVYVHNYLL